MAFRIIPTNTLFDELTGGLETGVITNIYGPAGSGKTNACMVISLKFLKSGKVAYVDTESGFSAERMKQIHSGNLDNLMLFEPADWEEQKSLVEKLRSMKPVLVVIDSAVSLFRLEDREFQEMNKELARYYKSLTDMAKQLSIPVLVTNQVYSWEGKVEMVGKTVSAYWSKAIIELEKTDRNGVRIATLRKHRSRPEGRQIMFEITSTGLKKAKRFGII